MSNKYVENSGEKPTHGMNKDEEMKRNLGKDEPQEARQ